MRNYTFIFVLLFTYITSSSLAQAPQLKYAKTGSNSNIDYFFADSLGNTYHAGTYHSTFTFDANEAFGSIIQESSTAYIMKVLANGKVSYLHSIKGLTDNYHFAITGAAFNQKGEFAVLFETPGISEFSIADRTIPANANENNMMIAKFSKNGFLMWVKRLNAIGAKPVIVASDLKIDEAGDVFVLGHFSGDKATFGSFEIEGIGNNYTIFLAKYSNLGVPVWVSGAKPLADTVGNLFSSKLELGTEGDIWAMGTMDGRRSFQFGDSMIFNKGIINTYLAKFNSRGIANWANACAGSGTILPENLVVDKVGKPTFGIYYNSALMRVNDINYSSSGTYNYLFSKYNKNGSKIYDYPIITNLPTVSGSVSEASLFLGDSLNIIAMGNINQLGKNHFYAMKFNNTIRGIKWTKTTSNTENVYFENAAADKHGNIYYSGNSYSNFAFGTINVANLGGMGVSYIGKLTNNGETEFIRSYQVDSTNNLGIGKLGADYYGNAYMTGNYSGSNAQIDNLPLNQKFNSGVFLAKLTNFSTISGKAINLSGNPVTNGHVKLLGFANFQRCVVADSVKLNADGSFLFTEVPYGKYILKFGSDGNDNYLQTYFPSAGYWKDAQAITVKQPLIENLYIFVSGANSLSGTGKLTGIVSEVDRDDAFKSVQNKPKSSTKAALAVKKTKSDYTIITETETDENGEFLFDNVAPGEYYIIIDEAGLPLVSTHTITISGGSFYSGIDYLISEEIIEATGTPKASILSQNFASDNEFRIFPNPSAGGAINIVVPENAAKSRIEIITLDGRTVEQMDIIGNQDVKLQLNTGFYLVKYSGEGQTKTIKLAVSK